MQNSIRQLVAAIAVTASGILAAPHAGAQVQGLPRLSQRARVAQSIGISEIEVVYHRPGVKGREVWGDLVPYGHVWRAGANENTVVTFSHPMQVEGTLVLPGMYGLHMIPGEKTWSVMLSKDSSSWGSFSYSQDLDAVRAEVTPEKAPFEEWLQYEFAPHSQGSVTLSLCWEELRVPVRIEVDTPELTLAKLREDLAGRFADRWQTWHDAAKYCLDSGLPTEEALGWIDRALEMQPSFANLAIRAGLLEGLDRPDEANQVMDQALELGNGNEIAGLGNEFLERGDHDRAVSFLEVALDKSPRLWWAWAALGQAYAQLGADENARASYDKAIEFAPDEGRKAFVRDLRDRLDRDG